MRLAVTVSANPSLKFFTSADASIVRNGSTATTFWLGMAMAIFSAGKNRCRRSRARDLHGTKTAPTTSIAARMPEAAHLLCLRKSRLRGGGSKPDSDCRRKRRKSTRRSRAVA